MIFLKICHIIIIQEIVIFSTIVVLRVMMIGFWCTTTEGVEVWNDIGWCAATKDVERQNDIGWCATTKGVEVWNNKGSSCFLFFLR